MDNLNADDPAIIEVIAKERQLHDPRIRRDSVSVAALLHPEFVEFGSSGRIWNTESIIKVLSTESTDFEIEARDFDAKFLAPNVILLTYKTENLGEVRLRSSIWVQSIGKEWLLQFHQGTVVTNSKAR